MSHVFHTYISYSFVFPKYKRLILLHLFETYSNGIVNQIYKRYIYDNKHLQMLMNVRSRLAYVVEEVSVRTPLAPTPAHMYLLLSAPLGLLLI